MKRRLLSLTLALVLALSLLPAASLAASVEDYNVLGSNFNTNAVQNGPTEQNLITVKNAALRPILTLPQTQRRPRNSLRSGGGVCSPLLLFSRGTDRRFAELLSGLRCSLASPCQGEVPQCAHWGGGVGTGRDKRSLRQRHP